MVPARVGLRAFLQMRASVGIGPRYFATSTTKARSQNPLPRFSFSLNGLAQEPIIFAIKKDFPELKRLSFFDTDVARFHISEATPFEFKPSGFDVFPEMARIYALLVEKLDADIKFKTVQRRFSELIYWR